MTSVSSTAPALERASREDDGGHGVLSGACKVETCSLDAIPTEEKLKEWLVSRNLDLTYWGRGNAKSLKHLWIECQQQECLLELWKMADGTLKPVRVAHVLRAKVCSPSSYRRNVFLFNTWQQFGDGRKRMRNGLLSEKLSVVDELPLEDNLRSACQRAVSEEMHRVTEALLRLDSESPAPQYDPSYECPLKVVEEHFVEKVVEVEVSKSFPGLLSMYHLYTVDVVCAGLPSVDFNTLEFSSGANGGQHKLKYVHAWVWMEWTQIQRYLFEGSALKERKAKDSFDSPSSLQQWLENHTVDTSLWGTGRLKSVHDLYNELQREETQLELWGKHDGVPLLMRVLHVLQVKVSSTDCRLGGKFLYHVWTQNSQGKFRPINRLLSTKLSTNGMPFELSRFKMEATELVNGRLKYFVDSNFRIDASQASQSGMLKDLDVAHVTVHNVDFVDHRIDVEESPAYKGLATLYHLYSCEAECEGLPGSNFASLEVEPHASAHWEDGADSPAAPYQIRNVLGFCWVTWPQCLDMVHSRTHALDSQLLELRVAAEKQDTAIQENFAAIAQMVSSVKGLLEEVNAKPETVSHMEHLIADVEQRQEQMAKQSAQQVQLSLREWESMLRRLPPSMVSELSQQTLISEAVDYAFRPSPSMVGILDEALAKSGPPSRFFCC